MIEKFIQRTFDLARFGSQFVRNNPCVGCVITNEQHHILGEGYHKEHGKAHAEVNAFNSIPTDIPDKPLHVYVSLEPCSFFGKTPACTDLISQMNVSKVMISTLDKTAAVNGNGKRLLKEQGIDVQDQILEKNGKLMVQHRTVIATAHRPYIILKWARSNDGYISKKNENTTVSNLFSKRLVHKWRSECDAILIGTNTALIDDPQLTNRLYFGPDPLRIVLDRQLRLPDDLKLFNDEKLTWVITEKEKPSTPFVKYVNLNFDDSLLPNLMQLLHEEQVGKVLVEGGAAIHNSFINANLYDEVRIIKSDYVLGDGVLAPKINSIPDQTVKMSNNTVSFFYMPQNSQIES